MIPTKKVELKRWLSKDTPGLYPVNPDTLQLAQTIAAQGWQERASERFMPAPEDMSGSCKFVSLFAKCLFGGDVRGNEDHQYNVIGGMRIDLNEKAADVQAMLDSCRDPYEHDMLFFNSRDHLDSLLSCKPRIEQWIERFENTLRNREANESTDTNDLQPRQPVM